MTSPAWRPRSAASLSGSTSVTTTPLPSSAGVTVRPRSASVSVARAPPVPGRRRSSAACLSAPGSSPRSTLTHFGLAVAPERHVDRLPGAMAAIMRASSLGEATSCAVDGGDHVAGLDAGLLAPGPSACAFGDQRALVGRQAEQFGDLRGHRLDLDAEPAALHRAVLHQILDDFARGRGGNGEGDADIAARRREDRGVDADHLAVEVEGRTAGIAAVHRRVDLDEVVIGAGADVAAAGRDDAGGHRAAEAERIADGNDPVADADLGVVGEVDIGELALRRRP